MSAPGAAAMRLGGLTLTRRIGSGGEADVFEVAERPGLVCKRYRQPTQERAAKLHVMLTHPPEGTRAGGHVSVAWPTELVTGERGEVVGFLMPRIDVTSAIPVFQVYNPATRARVAPGFTWRYLLRTARNVAAIVDAVHRAGHVVGDLNESNLLVDRRALVALVDCDSMQVTDPETGAIHRSPVGKPEFLAAEVHGRDLSAVDRTQETDAFALTVLIHQLLFEGLHPFAGVWRGRGDPPDVPTRIKKGWAATRRGWCPVDAPPHAVPLAAVPADVRRLVRRGLARRPAARPPAWEWVATLDALDGSLRTCPRSEHHVYASRRCPWCERIDRGLPDPFPGPGGTTASTLVRRPPPFRTRLWSRTRSGAGLVGRSVVGGAAKGRVAPVAAALAAAGWAWPVIAPVAVALVLLPLAFAVATPTRHVVEAWKASARLAVTSFAGSAAVAGAFVRWPAVLAAGSAVAAMVHGAVLPAALPSWQPARARLARLPWALPWAVGTAVVLAALVASHR